jgi:hypothetical protein
LNEISKEMMINSKKVEDTNAKLDVRIEDTNAKFGVKIDEINAKLGVRIEEINAKLGDISKANSQKQASAET